MALGRLETVVLDAADPQGLARFYAELLGWTVRREDEVYADPAGHPFCLVWG